MVRDRSNSPDVRRPEDWFPPVRPPGTAISTRNINTTAPITGGGNLSADRTLVLLGTKAQFNASCSDGDFLYVGDITQYTDEMARDALGLALVAGTNIAITVNDAADTITIATTGLGTAALKNTGTSGDVVPLLNAANTWTLLQTLTAGAVTDAANGFALFTGDPASYKICRNGTAVEIHGAGSVAAYAVGTLMWRTNGTTEIFFYAPIELQGSAEYRIGTNPVIDSSRLHRLRPYAVAALPAAGTAGRTAFVTDANSTTFASIVAGGGANGVPVYDDGTNWRIG